ncbi:hypothetical protein WJX84_008608 [Apatococcus fuscideae]|uniref:Pyruvate phosphate dikinase AMP/ATP-binding domain-containing protein n=1 Tax=Apatococcus fuscideae TaxID=2026836 RepID=A0AAW1SRE1_9CHLO
MEAPSSRMKSAMSRSNPENSCLQNSRVPYGVAGRDYKPVLRLRPACPLPLTLRTRLGRACTGYLSRAGRLRPSVQAQATAAPAAKSFERQYPLGKQNQLEVRVEHGDSGDQKVHLHTTLPGKLVLHWGVEGGQDYQGGWRLPGGSARPDGTIQYKDRALQTPWRPNGAGQQLDLQFQGPEASEALNFVIKDNSTGRWEYQNAIKELKGYLRQRVTVDELWKVANGEIKYADFKSSQKTQDQAQAPPSPPSEKDVQVPEELVGIQAYIMWEKAGKPDGADFSNDARKVLQEQLQSGTAVQDLERLLRQPEPEPVQAPPPKQEQQPEQHPDQADQAQAPPPPQAQPEQVQVGESIQAKKRDPLQMIKRAAPLLSAAKSESTPRPLGPLMAAAGADETCVWNRMYAMGNKQELLVTVKQPGGKEGATEVTMITDVAANVVLHWGVKKGQSGEWLLPEKDLWPEGSQDAGTGIAVDTPFAPLQSPEADLQTEGKKVPLQQTRLSISSGHDLNGLTFVVRSDDSTAWWRDGGSNFSVPIPGASAAPDQKETPNFEDEISREIVEAEQSNAWTLMHRYNKAHDLLEKVVQGKTEDPADAMARIFVWLRYSSSRQLTWQRNYNTQPRILGSAQERLTHKMAEVHSKTGGEAQEWIRSMLGTVGRGGNAQAVRDEILNIMHRNNIGEKKGTWMESWHQKLHNNTTPDDIPICEAYLAFMESGGDLGTYWRVLSDAGVTRQRLETFDRPIKEEPNFMGDKKDALLGEFRNYLGILKAVHSGADLNASAQAAGSAVPGSVKGYLGYVVNHQQSSQILPLIENAVEARVELQEALAGNRDLLYLDLALENVATAVVDRIRRAIAAISDSISLRVEPISRAFGNAFDVESWAVELFAEEVVRGGPAFAVSLALSAVEPALRASAELGAWQVISPAEATGKLVVVSGLHEVQDEVYTEPTVLLAKRVSGEEEVPEGAVAVLTPDAPDVLSHVSVRARNMKVLFAVCHADEPLQQLEALAGKTLAVQTSAAGNVTWEEVEAAAASSTSQAEAKPKHKMEVKVPEWCGKWVLPMDAFKDGVVGAKSKNIAGLRGKLPKEIALPPSVTIPFGSFEEALSSKANSDIREKLDSLMSDIPTHEAETVLKQCRELAMQVAVPEELQCQLKAVMKDAQIPVPESADRWNMALEALKGVWASKFNERACLSMRKVGLDFADLRMAVLVQRVVPAAYAFVIHTENPSTGAADEIYAEVVAGLGESIVSGMVPGTALSFVVQKTSLENPEVVMYPSKSDGMFVAESLIFRSDSNGEDLEGYAGAGLYDSITMDPTELRKVDYSSDRLLQDEAFRKDLMTRIAKAGLAIEEALGSAQDIEGAVEESGAITVVQTRPQM